jgi:hypothetical protein
MILEWKNKSGSYSAIFEDDGKVAYGYLFFNNEVVGDVWIYNCGDAPKTPEWKFSQNMPFANPIDFISSEKFPPAKEESELSLSWDEDNLGVVTAIFMIRNSVIAKVKHGSKPGWCKLAIKNGPLAKVF